MRSLPNPNDRKLPYGSDKCCCSTCGEYFNSTLAFDRHRTGKMEARRCLTGEEMRAKGFDVNKTGHWITSHRPRQTLPE